MVESKSKLSKNKQTKGKQIKNKHSKNKQTKGTHDKNKQIKSVLNKNKQIKSKLDKNKLIKNKQNKSILSKNKQSKSKQTKSKQSKSYLNMIENRNTYEYRNIKRNVLSKLKIDITKRYLIDYKFDEVKIISKPENSVSNSIIYLLKSKNKQYIFKITGMNHKIGKLSPPDTEKTIYSIMNILVNKNITPHVFTLTNSTNTEIPISKINKILQKDLKKLFSSKVNYIYPFIIETSDYTKKNISMYDFFILIIEKKIPNIEIIFLIILFQIMYTLNVFNIIGVKHNDLHLKNIMVQINYKNILSKNHDIYLNKYIIHDNEYLIPNIGIDIRIYDFDRSCKFSNKIYPEYKFIESTEIKSLHNVNTNCNVNESFDTFKILGSLYSLLKKYKDLVKLQLIIESFFYDKKLLNLNKGTKTYLDKYTNIKYNDIILDGSRYYLIDKQIPETIMMNTNSIANKLGELIKSSIGDISNIKQYQTFSTNNIKN